MNDPKPPPIPIHPQTIGIMGRFVRQQREDAIGADLARAMAALKPPPFDPKRESMNSTRLCISGPNHGKFVHAKDISYFDFCNEDGEIFRYLPRELAVDTRRSGAMLYKLFVFGEMPPVADVVALLSVYQDGDDLIDYMRQSAR